MAIDRRYYDMPDGRISAIHFNSDKGAPKILFAHANGFNAQCYRDLFQSLPCHSVVLDLRGHGFSDLPIYPKTIRSFKLFWQDIIYFSEHYMPEPFIMSGHSFGAICAMMACVKLKKKVTRYVGFDPPTLPLFPRVWPYLPGGLSSLKYVLPIARNAGRRRKIFESKEAVFNRYKGRGAFKKFSDDALWDYIHGGFLEDPEGVRLACDPAWEQAIFVAQGQNIYKVAANVPENSALIYADKTQVSFPSTRTAISKRLNGTVTLLENTSHLFPIYAPEITKPFFMDPLSDFENNA